MLRDSASLLFLLLLLFASACNGAGDAADPNASASPEDSASPAVDAGGGETADAEAPPLPVLPTGPLNGGCAANPGAGHQTITCSDGVVFDVEVSPDCARGLWPKTRKGCGLILDVHGWSMDGPMEDRHTRLRELAVPRGFIVVQPTAPGDPPSWATDKPTGREFAFDETVWRFTEATMQRFAVDSDRVHMTGFSQGGMMTFRFLFAHADAFASVAPIAGPDGFLYPTNAFASIETTGWAPPIKIPILYTHGTKDRMLSFEKIVPALKEEILRAYGLGLPETIHDEPTYRAARWRDDAGRTMFELWDHDFAQGNIYIAGHCVSGPFKDGDGAFRQSDIPFRCLDAVQYDLGAELVRFFEEHPKGR